MALKFFKAISLVNNANQGLKKMRVIPAKAGISHKKGKMLVSFKFLFSSIRNYRITTSLTKDLTLNDMDTTIYFGRSILILPIEIRLSIYPSDSYRITEMAGRARQDDLRENVCNPIAIGFGIVV